MLRSLHSELDVLSRAVAYSNLSHAAQHIGLSQPQLSRILKKIEGELGISLLDRAAKRKSGWTELAHSLAQTFLRATRSLEGEILALAEGKATPNRIRVGFLEGLLQPALELAEFIYGKTEILQVEMDVMDLGPLERNFLKGEFDLILTSREPGRQKYSHSRRIGNQILVTMNRGAQVLTLSPYEINAVASQEKKRIDGRKVLLSNSLAVRRLWIERGAEGVLPSGLKPIGVKGEGLVPVYLLAGEMFPNVLWRQLTAFKKE